MDPRHRHNFLNGLMNFNLEADINANTVEEEEVTSCPEFCLVCKYIHALLLQPASCKDNVSGEVGDETIGEQLNSMANPNPTPTPTPQSTYQHTEERPLKNLSRITGGNSNNRPVFNDFPCRRMITTSKSSIGGNTSDKDDDDNDNESENLTKYNSLGFGLVEGDLAALSRWRRGRDVVSAGSKVGIPVLASGEEDCGGASTTAASAHIPCKSLFDGPVRRGIPGGRPGSLAMRVAGPLKKEEEKKINEEKKENKRTVDKDESSDEHEDCNTDDIETESTISAIPTGLRAQQETLSALQKENFNLKLTLHSHYRRESIQNAQLVQAQFKTQEMEKRLKVLQQEVWVKHQELQKLFTVAEDYNDLFDVNTAYSDKRRIPTETEVEKSFESAIGDVKKKKRRCGENDWYQPVERLGEVNRGVPKLMTNPDQISSVRPDIVSSEQSTYDDGSPLRATPDNSQAEQTQRGMPESGPTRRHFIEAEVERRRKDPSIVTLLNGRQVKVARPMWHPFGSRKSRLTSQTTEDSKSPYWDAINDFWDSSSSTDSGLRQTSSRNTRSDHLTKKKTHTKTGRKSNEDDQDDERNKQETRRFRKFLRKLGRELNFYVHLRGNPVPTADSERQSKVPSKRQRLGRKSWFFRGKKVKFCWRRRREAQDTA